MSVEKFHQLLKSHKHNRYFAFKLCNLMINFHSFFSKIGKIIYNFANQFKTHILCSVTFFECGTCDEMMWKFLLTGQATDCIIHVM